MKLIHLVLRSRWPLEPFTERAVCVEAWSRLRERFRTVLACVLMPNHVHLINQSANPAEDRAKLAAVATALQRSRFPGKVIWDAVPEPQLIPDLKHLKRQIRYVHLNPCRSKLAVDPLQWEWSTHRDASGAAHPAWLDIPFLCKVFETTRVRLPAILHSYVSADPSVHPEGTSFPAIHEPGHLSAPLPHIHQALLQATRTDTHAHSSRIHLRRLSIHLATRLGTSHRSNIAKWLNVTPQTVSNARSHTLDDADEATLRAAGVILSAFDRFAFFKKIKNPRLD